MNTDRNRRGLARAALWLGLVLCVATTTASATPAVIESAPTTLTSTVDRMISYREQNHMWQTSDGGTHVFLNRGASGGSALSLNSSYNGGATWISAVATLPSSGITTTSDGYLDDDDLYVTYSGVANDIRFAHLRYNLGAKTWAVISTQVVYATTTAVALTPAMAVDAMGTRWLAFTNQDVATSNYSIKMMRQDAGSNTWVDTGFTFGAVDNLSNERSGRPIATATGMGIIYTVHQNIYWAQRNNNWAPGATWPRSQVYANRAADKDPYGTHYSASADAQKNIHLVWVDGGQLVYSRFMAATQAWEKFRTLTPDIKATYMQVVVSLSNIVIISNNLSSLGVYQSSDGGNSFVYTQILQHPPATGKISYANPREEAPGHSSSPIPVLQQYVDGDTQKALFFPVPVVRVPTQP